jgi:actin-related protein 8
MRGVSSAENVEMGDVSGPAATTASSRAPSPAANGINGANGHDVVEDEARIAEEASHFPLDAAIAASIAQCGTETKSRAVAGAILVIGGSSAIKGLNAFLEER